MPTGDAHVHLFANGFSGSYGRLLHDEAALYEQLRHRFGIERALVVGYEGEAAYIGNNAYILDLARDRAWIAPLAYLRSDQAPATESLRRLMDDGAIGYSLYLSDAPEARAVGAWPQAVMRELQGQRAIISLNATPAATAAVAPFIDALVECTFLFSHLGLPGRFQHTPTQREAVARLQPLRALAERHNVAVKLSGLYAITEPPHDYPHTAARAVVDAVLGSFGPARLYWGSDFAPALDFVSFAQLADERLLADLSASDAAGVMGENLRRLLPPSRDEE
jgi:L-fuconolactonase